MTDEQVKMLADGLHAIAVSLESVATSLGYIDTTLETMDLGPDHSEGIARALDHIATTFRNWKPL